MNTYSDPLFHLGLMQIYEGGVIMISLLRRRKPIFGDIRAFARGTSSDAAEPGPPARVL